MRLIDADALKNDIVEEGQKSKRYKIGEFWELGRDQIWIVIDKQPTIEKRKTGEWVDFSMSIKGVPTEACGECGEWSYGMGKNFCPNCGADMRVKTIYYGYKRKNRNNVWNMSL